MRCGSGLNGMLVACVISSPQCVYHAAHLTTQQTSVVCVFTICLHVHCLFACSLSLCMFTVCLHVHCLFACSLSLCILSDNL